MKKIALVFTLAFFGALQTSNAWIVVNTTRSNGGWFGYGNIQENLTKNGTNCTFTLLCWNSGWSHCGFSSLDIKNPDTHGCQRMIINVPGGSWYDQINTDIEAAMAVGQTNGTMVRSDIKISHPATGLMENSVTVWQFTEPTNNILMRVYSYSEAVGLGIVAPTIGG